METEFWTIDQAHSEIGFKVKYMMFTYVSGKFQDFHMSFNIDDDNFETSVISFSAKVSSIDTNNVERDNHLISSDFFDEENYPLISFLSSEIKKISEEIYQVKGILNIKETSKTITLQTRYSGIMTDPWGKEKIGISLSGDINRKEFGLNWNSTLDGILIADDVDLEIELQLIKNK